MTQINARLIKAETKWQMTYLNVFSWMKIVVFRLKFHWHLFLRIQ